MTSTLSTKMKDYDGTDFHHNLFKAVRANNFSTRVDFHPANCSHDNDVMILGLWCT